MPAPLFQRLTDPQNLYGAWTAVKKKKGAPGCDGQTVEDFARNENQNILVISTALRRGAYEPLPFREHFIPKPSPGKWRRLSIPAVRDRVVLQCANSILQQEYDRIFAPCSFAYRPGKSIRDAIALLRHGISLGLHWAVRGDIRGCFDEIDRGILSSIFKATVNDQLFAAAVLKFIAVPVIGREGIQNPGRGIPQGSPLSPFLSNLYLHPFDCALLARGCFLVRFADDWTILAPDYPASAAALKTAVSAVSSLNIALNAGKSGIFDLRQTTVPFLGHTIGSASINADEKGWQRAFASARNLQSAATREEYTRARGRLRAIQSMYIHTGKI